MTSRAGGAKVLSKRYELSRKLGTGGMADVFLGRDRVLGRTVAVKMLLPQYADDPQFLARFRREAQSAAALNHPNVVGVYDTGSDSGTHYIVMEFVEGKTLRDLIREEGPLLPERGAEIGSEASAALSFAHSRGIVHRDVKPGNIMITGDGSVKVTDFGIARAMSGESVTQTAMVLGTAQYFSPEQAEGKPVDARSDVYSLGVVLYEILTRQVPFTGSSPVAIAYKHVKEAPIPPSRLNPDVPKDLEAIVMKAMAKNPANRYQSAQELREDLLRWLDGRPVTAPPLLDDATSVVSPLAEETVVVSRRASTQGATTGTRTRIVDQDEEIRRRRATGYVLLTLITLGIIAVLIWAIAGALSKPKILRVPAVIGMKVAEAQRVLRDKGFDVTVADPVPSTEYESGVIALQSPDPGAERAEGRTVSITPSSGPQLVLVPDLKGKTETQAEEILEKAGLKVGQVDRVFSDSVEDGRVVRQNPRAGTSLRAGEAVDLDISKGREMVIVPDVVGLSEEVATKALRDRKLRVKVLYKDEGFECPQQPGNVCGQDPQKDSEVREGTEITITVAQVPGSSPTPTDSVTPGENPIP